MHFLPFTGLFASFSDPYHSQMKRILTFRFISPLSPLQNEAEKLIQKGCSVQGIEPSSVMREMAKEKFPDLKLMTATLFSSQFLSEAIDSIVNVRLSTFKQ